MFLIWCKGKALFLHLQIFVYKFAFFICKTFILQSPFYKIAFFRYKISGFHKIVVPLQRFFMEEKRSCLFIVIRKLFQNKTTLRQRGLLLYFG